MAAARPLASGPAAGPPVADAAADRPGLLLGFALGGFFDGILLHQILQWHHLLSAVDGRGDDIAFQVLADGLFHAFMYVLGAIGLWWLWRAMRDARGAPDGRRLAGALAIGFGAWHVVDTFVSHWWLGIHRIRTDVANPLAWDVLWLVAFGLVPIALGGVLRRRSRARPLHRATAASIAAAVALAGALAGIPPRDGAAVLALYAPGTAPDAVMDGVAAVGGGLVWFDARAGLWAIDVPDGASTRALYAHGAWFVAPSWLSLGCFSWLRATPAPA